MLLGALAGVLCGWSVGIPMYLWTMLTISPLNCLLGPVTCCLIPIYGIPALLMSCAGGELAGILSWVMPLPCKPLVPVVAGLLGGIVGCFESSIVGCFWAWPLSCGASFCGPCLLCSPCIGVAYTLVDIPITVVGGTLTGLMGGSGPLLGLVGGIGSIVLSLPCAPVISELCGFLPAEAGIPGFLSGSAVGALTAIPRAGLVIAASTVGGPIGIVLATIAQACVGLGCGICEGFDLGFCAL